MTAPSSFALIAEKSIVHKSPIAKKLTTNHENRSSDHPRSKFVNSNSEVLAILSVVLPFLLGINSILKLLETSFEIWVLSSDLNPLISAVINISERLSAATVITGAKISLKTLPISRCLSKLHNASFGIKSVKTFLITKNGDAAI